MEKRSAEERVVELERRLQVSFPEPRLALSALTHKSFLNEHKEHPVPHNERLEFLGDAVVDLAISHRLMQQFPEASEGELSRLRALIVNEEGLARVARAVGLGELLLLGRGEERTGGRTKSSLLADALEAVLGALYLGAPTEGAQPGDGLARVLELVDRLFSEALAGVASGKNGLDYKTRLQEQAQLKLKLPPRYRVVAEAGPEHEKVFEVEVTLGEAVSARAGGRSKKEAEQAAAQKALLALDALSAQDIPR